MGAVIVGVGVTAACVGDDPSSNGAAVPDGGSATDATSVTDSGGVEDGGADGADAGPTRPCDPQKPFVAKGAIAGIADVVIPDLSMAEPELEAVVAIYRADAGAHLGGARALRPIAAGSEWRPRGEGRA